MISFAREITNDKIIEVKMEKRNIYYEVKGDLLVTIVTSPNIPRKKLSFVFQCILTKFQERFREFLNHNILTREPFRSFSNDLDILLIQFGLLENYLIVPAPPRHSTPLKTGY